MRALAIASLILGSVSAISVEDSPFPQLLTIMKDWAVELQREHGIVAPAEYAYFNFMPMQAGAIKPVGAKTSWSTPCFKNNVASASFNGTNQVVVEVVSTGASSLDCRESYTFMTFFEHHHAVIHEGRNTFTMDIPADVKPAELWDLNHKGIRAMRFNNSFAEVAANIFESLKLFVPEFTQNVDPVSAKRNVDFMAKYPRFVMEERDPLSNLPPPEHMVHSGDFFGVIRLDGLDPMLAWGMGSTTGHAVAALWIDGELYICESTVVDSYWPTNGIQKTPYRQWLKQAEAAGYNVVWVPLNRQYRSKFDEKAAVDFFRSVEGLDYGYKTMLWTWVDTIKDNYPCVPPTYDSVCLTWELIEPLFAYIDRKIPDISNLMWNDAWNKRVGTTDLGTAEIYKKADELGIAAASIPAIVEQDSWMYNTTKYDEPVEGRAMVCCVFVCHLWKNAGIFGDMDINCNEVTNIDDYSLAIFEPEYQQILGRYTLTLNKFNVKTPYPHMAETCASFAPDYTQDPQC